MDKMFHFLMQKIEKTQQGRSITHFLKPYLCCFICHSKTRKIVCEGCLKQLTKLNIRCQTCATPLLYTKDTHCGQCIRTPPALDQVFTAYAYTAPLRFLIHHFKYHEGYFLTPILTQLLLDALPQNYKTDCIIPVPTHTKRIQERGFDHTLWLAKHIRQITHFHIDTQSCKKITHTQSSTQLCAKERKKNKQKIYSIKAMTNQHITLLDDLTTTGETANTLAKLLKKNGAQSVNLWCCAKTIRT